MKILKGKSICKKVRIGEILYFEKPELEVKRTKIDDVKAEEQRFEDAKTEAAKQLEELLEKAREEVGEAEAAIFEIHIMMLDDQDYKDSVYNIIETQNVCAEYAVATTGENFAHMFSEMDDEYMQARSADVKDISERIVHILLGGSMDSIMGDKPVIVVADDLAPSETVQLDKDKLLGFATLHGSMNSHTAILARTMGIPALVNVEIDKEWNGKQAIIDGYAGELIIEPNEEQLVAAKKKIDEDEHKEVLLKKLKGKETITKSGQKVNLYANIGSVADVGMVLQNDAEGIGLFRSEFLYLQSDDFPTEDEQFNSYKTVASNMAGKKVVIRTLDIGADKQADYFNLAKEENPAMGYRAIRICLKQPDIFNTQLRAILRAAAFGKISIMFPMIISKEEVMAAKAQLERARTELKTENIPYGDVEVGIMIETPAAVMISEELAKEVDFFSIGTNDLTQYTLAADRQNPNLDDIIDTHHPAILKMIAMTIENGHKHGAWVGICGELGADLNLTEKFVAMGVDELSVSPNCILEIREKICSIK